MPCLVGVIAYRRAEINIYTHNQVVRDAKTVLQSPTLDMRGGEERAK